MKCNAIMKTVIFVLGHRFCHYRLFYPLKLCRTFMVAKKSKKKNKKNFIFHLFKMLSSDLACDYHQTYYTYKFL